MSEQQAAPVFSIEKLYVKDLSVETPNSPACFLEREAPEVEVQLQTAGTAVGEDAYEVVLTVTVTAKIGEKTQFLAEAAQAGIFRIANVPGEEMEPIIAVACPNILFPYVRETISDCVSRAGFPPVILAPVNFEAIYLQRQQQQAATSGPHEVPVQ
ncbi:MAG: protein-export chaperone SecB [Rhodocyclaceae bacterium]|nr:protein-export chaperone SecB [Rhodocyclaceae bacterium]